MFELRETTSTADRLGVLAGTLLSAHGLSELLSVVLSQITGLLRADDGAVFMVDDAGRLVRGITLEQTRSGILDRDTGQEARWFGRLGGSLTLIIPLVAEDRWLGLLYLNFRDRNAWPAQPAVRFAEALAARAAMVLGRRLAETGPSGPDSALRRSAIDGVIVIDPMGRVVWINPVGEQLTGWSLPVALGRPLEEVFELLGSETGRRRESLVRRALRDGLVLGAARPMVLVGRDGTEWSIAYSVAPIRDAPGAAQGAVVLFRVVREQSQPRTASHTR